MPYTSGHNFRLPRRHVPLVTPGLGGRDTLADFFSWPDDQGCDVHDLDPNAAGLIPMAVVAPGVSKNFVAPPRI